MYLIDKMQNRISKVTEKTFAELGFRERDHLQEWLANKPEALGEELLIIQKEFNGFNDTNERLDLLALDKQGNLVIIEDKLDDSGRDVTWQALKYTAYCSTLKTSQIKSIYQQYLDKKGLDEKAEDKLIEFYGQGDYENLILNSGQTQRIIMVAAKFRKEVTSTVFWLLNYKLRIQCFKVTPYALDNELFLDIEQVIPLKDAEEYMIGMAEKNQEDISTQEDVKNRHILRVDFWKLLLKEMNAKSSLFQNISPSKDNWIGAGTGIGNVSFQFAITGTYAGIALYMWRSNTMENKYIFDELYKVREEVEAAFGDPLEWRRLDGNKGSDILFRKTGVSVFNKEDWPKMINFMVDSMIRFEKAFQSPLKKIGQQLKAKDFN
ncbi:MAG: hypothetical protein K0Q87_3326 [Neobacillus sp.]|nr:hypothetical protein [Neobacillus sp.]